MCASPTDPTESGPLALAVLISGFGSNLQAILDEIAAGVLPARVAAVISDQPDAYGLTRARDAGVPAVCVARSAYPNRRAFEAALRAAIDTAGAQLIVLAGFMRVLSAGFVAHYPDRIINIHPSLLPAYRGLDTHARVLADGCPEHGASVHFVTAELDAGPIIVQGRVLVRPEDTPETLAARVHEQEHRILPQAIRWIAQQRLSVVDGAVHLDGAPTLPGVLIKTAAHTHGQAG